MFWNQLRFDYLMKHYFLVVFLLCNKSFETIEFLWNIFTENDKAHLVYVTSWFALLKTRIICICPCWNVTYYRWALYWKFWQSCLRMRSLCFWVDGYADRDERQLKRKIVGWRTWPSWAYGRAGFVLIYLQYTSIHNQLISSGFLVFHEFWHVICH